jgi:membrane fusion protein (multidrug efflux system)
MAQRLFRLVLLGTAALIVACGKKDAAGAGGMPPAEVGVVRVTPQAVPLTRDLVGRTSATRASDVRARVAGVLLKRLYDEGSDVKEGQVLFQIDPAPLQAAYSSAQAGLASAEATYTNAHVLAERLRRVANDGYVSKSDLDSAEANERSAEAAVKQARASVQTARINLGYATVRAPISGRAGQQRVTEGALVGQSEPTLLTVVEQIDPLYVNFDQPANEILELRRAQAEGNVALAESGKAHLQLTLPDGTPYGQEGTLDFSDLSVDPATGAMALRGIVPNPEHRLLPGMFVNVRFAMGVMNNAMRVPQSAVQLDAQGAYVMVVQPDGKAAQKRIRTAGTSGNTWIVTAGLKSGDAVVVSGLQRAMPGAPVKAVPYEEKAQAAAGPQGGPGPGI